jgi:hypothetical protein
MVFSEGSRGYLWIFKWLESFGVKEQGLLQFGNFLGILLDFWSVWCGLGPICRYFLETKGPTITSQKNRDHRLIYNKLRDLTENLHRIWKFPDYFPMGHLKDRVHGAVDRQRGQVHGGPVGGTNVGNGDTLLGCGTRALDVTGAHQ